MRWIYLSPHFDDVVLSCGGMVWEQAQSGQKVEAWTVCAGGPGPDEPLSAFAQSLHARWETGPAAVPARQAEDQAALRRLGAIPRYWSLPDCIYRRLPGGEWLVNGEEDLWQPVHPQEQIVVDRLAAWLVQGLEVEGPVALVSPLTLGNHVDHYLVRAAAEQAAAATAVPLYYYPDYPYAAKAAGQESGKLGKGWQQACQPVSPAALRAWQDAVACYESQISTFWTGRAALDAALEAYWQAGGGTCLWYSPRIQLP